MATALGSRRDPFLAFNFLVEIQGLVVGGFREVRGLESHVEVKEFAEGGRNGYLHRIPGETRYPNLVLTRGLTDRDELWGWYQDVCKGLIVRRNATIVLLDSARRRVIGWDILGALPVRWTGPTLDANRGTEVAAESIELVHQGILRPVQG